VRGAVVHELCSQSYQVKFYALLALTCGSSSNYIKAVTADAAHAPRFLALLYCPRTSTTSKDVKLGA